MSSYFAAPHLPFLLPQVPSPPPAPSPSTSSRSPSPSLYLLHHLLLTFNPPSTPTTPTSTHQLDTNLHPPSFTHQPPPTNLHPPSFTHQPPPTNLHPPSFTHQPTPTTPPTNLHPPTTTHHPPPTNLHPPTSTHHPPPTPAAPTTTHHGRRRRRHHRRHQYPRPLPAFPPPHYSSTPPPALSPAKLLTPRFSWQEVALLRDELRRSHDALAVSQKHLGVLASHLHTLTSASPPPSVDPRTSHSSILSNCLTDAPVPLSQVKGLVGDHTPLAVPPLAFLLSQQQLSRRSAPSARLPSAPSLASSPPQAAPTASSASHVAPSLASYQPPSVRSLKSSSRSRDRLSREPNPLKQMAHVLQRLVRPEEAEREEVRLGAVLLIQAVARGAAARRQLRLRRAVNAHVHEATILTKPSRCWGVVSIPCYTITVIRDSSTWTVHHRYSDWRDLHALLRPLLPSLPPLPPKRPFRSSRVTRHRQGALDAYLQRVIPLAAASPAARRLLLDFLSKSHQSWKYDAVPPPAEARRPAVYDRSSGATASSVVGRRTAPPPAAARRLASAREARAPTRAALERQATAPPVLWRERFNSIDSDAVSH